MFKKLYQMAMAGDMEAVLQLAQACLWGLNQRPSAGRHDQR